MDQSIELKNVRSNVELLLAFPDLREVDIAQSALTGAGIARLASQARLSRLKISEIEMPAESFRRLSECNELKELNIRHINADAQVVEYLKKALPKCRIEATERLSEPIERSQ